MIVLSEIIMDKFDPPRKLIYILIRCHAWMIDIKLIWPFQVQFQIFHNLFRNCDQLLSNTVETVEILLFFCRSPLPVMTCLRSSPSSWPPRAQVPVSPVSYNIGLYFSTVSEAGFTFLSTLAGNIFTVSWRQWRYCATEEVLSDSPLTTDWRSCFMMNTFLVISDGAHSRHVRDKYRNYLLLYTYLCVSGAPCVWGL